MSPRLSGGSDGKESVCNIGDLGSTLGSERSPGEENGNPLQYSCLQNPMDRGAWRTTVHRVTKSQTQLKQLSTHARPRCYNRHFRYVDRCECECESCSFTSNSLQPHGLHSPWNSLGQNTGVGSCSLLQGIFPGLPHCRWILYQLSHQGSP